MPSPALILSLLLTATFSLSVTLEPRYDRATHRSGSESVLAAVLGDGRRLFANHFFVKADAYFHSGYYPTIFDHKKLHEATHIEEAASGEERDEHRGPPESGEDFLGPPRDWIDRFGRNFFSSHHSHLEKGGAEREILPWLKLTAELDPQKIKSYTVAAYWLRRHLHKPEDAEQFLRQGLRANPGSPEILFELGLIYREERKDLGRARNLFELAGRKWEAQIRAGAKPDPFVYEQIVGQLAGLEEAAGNFPAALHYLEILKQISPIPADIEKQIQELKTKLK
jgi:tetratricopeptide (TPR) repeat protein